MHPQIPPAARSMLFRKSRMSAHRSARSPPSRRPVSAVGAAAHRGAAAILEEILNEPMPSSACALKDRGLGVPHLIGQAMPENSIAATRWPRGRASFGEKKSVDGELDPRSGWHD